MNDCGINWGATVSDASVWVGGDQWDWSVTVESEPLAAPLDDGVLRRFADAAGLDADDTASYSRVENTIGMTLTVRASGSDEAAHRAAHAFERALAVALWPRYQPSAAEPWRVEVAPVEPMLAAA